MRLKFLGVLMTILFTPITVNAELFVLSATSEQVSETFVTASRLNLRPDPSTDNTRLMVVDSGVHVTVLSYRCGEWYEVEYNGVRGYMYSEHLRKLSDITEVLGASENVGEIELLEWSEAKNILTLGTIAVVTDVRTGISWNMASFSNGNHADIEPITSDDTALMKQAFGEWTWTPRPVLIQINGRTLAASLNGMPHAGSTRSNSMNGHVCMHFKGSTTHSPTTASHLQDHQNAVMEAYNSGLNQ